MLAKVSVMGFPCISRYCRKTI